MKKLGLALALVLGIALIAPQHAEAKDLSGRFGVGADSSLGWSANSPAGPANIGGQANTGLSLVFYFSKMFGIQLIAGSTITSISADNDVSGFASLVNVGVRGIIPIAFTNDVNLGAVLGFSGVFGSGDAFDPDNSDTDVSPLFISFDLGLRPEWFITDHFSIHTQLGVAISLINDDNIGVAAGDPTGMSTGGLQNSGGVGINIFNNANLLGNAGFTFWF